MSSYIGAPPGHRNILKHQNWWKLNQNSVDVANAIFTTVEYLDDQQQSRHELYLSNLRLYSNRAAMSLSGKEFMEGADGGQRIRLNVVKSAIDTAVAHIATQKPRPLYLTKGGSYENRVRAENLTKFMLGQFKYMSRYPQGLQIFRDGLVFGPGIEKFYADAHRNGRICSERVFPDEIVVDEEEAKTGDPRQMFQVKDIPREVLVAQFPKFEKDIAHAPRIREERTVYTGLSEPATVIEAWHLPSGPKARDGRHVICIGNKVLFDEEWKLESFPFAIFNWSDPILGWSGISVAEELAPIQLEINYIAQKIQRLMTLATSLVWKEKGSGTGRVINKDWAQYEYSGKPPIFQNVSSVSAEYFNHLDRLYQRAFEIVGISQLAAQSQIPAGLESGAAIKVYNDVGTKRFQHVAQRWEQFHLDAAERIYDVARGLRGTKVLAQGDHDIEEIDFQQAYLERDKYTLQVYPANLLPEEPAGQVDAIAQLATSIPGLQPYLPMALEGIPDLKYIVGRHSSPIKIAQKMVGNILSGKEFEAPFPGMDLQVARQVGTQELLNAFVDDVPVEKRNLLRRWLGQVDGLIAKANPPMPAGGMGPPPAQVAPPTPGGQPTLASPQPPAGPQQPPAGPPPLQ